MKRTTVHIDDDSLRALKRMSRELGRPEASLIREAIATYTKSSSPVRPRSIGIASGPIDLAERTDEHLDAALAHEAPRRGPRR